MYSEEQMYQALEAAHTAGDSDGAMQIAQMIQGYQSSQPREKGFTETVSDMFTGADRETEQSQNTPELTSGNLQALAGGVDPSTDLSDVLSGKVKFGEGGAQGNPLTNFLKDSIRKFTSSDEEVAAIAMDQYPNLQKQSDEKGNLYIVNPETGDSIAVNSPGLSMTDLQNLAYTTAAFTPAGRGASVIGAIGKNAAVQAAIEGGQMAAGGEFNPLDVAIAGGAGGLAKKAENVVGSFVRGKSDQAEELMEQAIDVETGRISNPLSGESQGLNAAQMAARQTAATESTAENLAKMAGSKNTDYSVASELVQADPKILAAAEAEGVLDDLTPAQLSGNKTFRQISGALEANPLSSQAASSQASFDRVAEIADNWIEEFGGSLDKAGLGDKIKSRFAKDIEKVKIKEGGLYDQIDDTVRQAEVGGDLVRVAGDDVFAALSDKATKLDGLKNLGQAEKKVYELFKDGKTPSYHLIDNERKKIGAAMRNSQKTYGSEDEATLSGLYSMLTDAQEAATKSLGVDDAWAAAKGWTVKRKELEENSIKMLGKELSGSVMPKLGRATKGLASGEFKQFDEIMNALPKKMRERAAVSAMTDAFTGSGSASKSLTPSQFVNFMDGLNKNKAAKARLMKHLPKKSQQRLENIYELSRGLSNASKEVVRTGISSNIVAKIDEVGERMLYKLHDSGKAIAAAEAATSSLGIPGMGTALGSINSLMTKPASKLSEAADLMIGSEEFKRFARQLADNTARGQALRSQAEVALRRSARYKRWFERLPNEGKRAILKGGLTGYLTTTNDEF